MMKTSFYNLIVFSPGDPQVLKFHISRQAIVILIVAFLVSFLVTVAVGYTVGPEKLSSAEHLRLRAENLSLNVENKNAEIQNQRLQANLENIERLSSRVSTLIDSH
jgi:hypothetical protein